MHSNGVLVNRRSRCSKPRENRSRRGSVAAKLVAARSRGEELRPSDLRKLKKGKFDAAYHQAGEAV